MAGDFELLKKRFIELAERSYSSGIFTFTDFLGLAEQDVFEEAKAAIRPLPFTLFGGAVGTERVMVRFGDSEELGYELPFPIVALKIAPRDKKFADRLSHRDFLGSLIGLGIERAALGDIIVLPDGDKSAVAFCDSRIASFICAELTKVSRDKVRVSVTEIKEDFIPERKFVDINEPISSTRLDCIVCALCSVSRERASELISAGLVEIDFETEEKPDRRREMPCVATVRGFGKYKLLRADAKTRKGRLRLEAKKYS